MGIRVRPEDEAKILELAGRGPSLAVRLPGADLVTRPPPSAKPPRKYRNEPVEVDGVRFDSKKEARRWAELVLMERAGRITQLRRQVAVPVVVGGEVVCEYVADAVYFEAGTKVFEDTKSPATRRNPVYRLKRKLLKALYGIDVRET